MLRILSPLTLEESLSPSRAVTGLCVSPVAGSTYSTSYATHYGIKTLSKKSGCVFLQDPLCGFRRSTFAFMKWLALQPSWPIDFNYQPKSKGLLGHTFSKGVAGCIGYLFDPSPRGIPGELSRVPQGRNLGLGVGSLLVQ